MLRQWYWKLPRDAANKISWVKYARRLVLKLTLWFFGLSIGFTLLYAVVPVPCTCLMFSRIFQQMGDSNREVRWKKDWVSIEEISPSLQLAVVCSEDQEFLEHDGFDLNAIQKAYKYNQTHKRKRGASTISQQTAKNVFLWENRSWIRKGLEVYFTFLIEIIWSKERIMEVYLNVIEFGDGIYGAEAASQFYYGKSAKDINRAEAAMLASVLPSPLKLSPKNPTAEVKEKQQWIMRQMRMWGGVLDFEEPNTPHKK